MGGSVSIPNNINSRKQVKQLPPPRKRFYIGLRNYGCTCYANSVIQLLYYCDSFRMKLEEQYCHVKKEKNNEEEDEDLGYLLYEIFNELSILYVDNDTYVSPRSFISSIFTKSHMFGSSEQQDAHEFLMYLLNDISDTIKAEITNKDKKKKKRSKEKSKDTTLQLEQENEQEGEGEEEGEEGGGEEEEVEVEVEDDENENETNTESTTPRSLPPPNSDRNSNNALVGSQSKSCVLQPEIEIPIEITTNTPQTSSTTTTTNTHSPNTNNINNPNSAITSNNIKTFIEDLFEGTIVSTVKCLTCNNTSVSKETFLHLSVDVVPNVSLTDSLRKYCDVEHLNGSNQFFCQKCNSLQDAEKSIRISKLPPLLIIHIKRFKYNDKIKDLEKLCSRVLYPYSLRIPIQSLDGDCISPHYKLSGTVVHIGHSGLSGHYVCTVDDGSKYIILDDHNVNINYYPYLPYGTCLKDGKIDSTGYILLYSSIDNK